MDVNTSPVAASVSCVSLHKSYVSELDGARWRHTVLRDVSLVVRAGRCATIVGIGLGPLTVLRCLAGLVVPERGSLSWRDKAGRAVGPSACAIIPAGWQPYACHTVRDVLEQAVPPGVPQADADCRVSAAAQRCGLTSALDRRAATLPASGIRLVATAAALVAGIRWILLDRSDSIRGPRTDEGRHACRGASVGSPAITSIVPAELGAARLERRVLLGLCRSGLAVVAAGPAARLAWLSPADQFSLASCRLEREHDSEATRRVAEPEPLQAVPSGAQRMISAPTAAIAAPVATTPGSR